MHRMTAPVGFGDRFLTPRRVQVPGGESGELAAKALVTLAEPIPGPGVGEEFRGQERVAEDVPHDGGGDLESIGDRRRGGECVEQFVRGPRPGRRGEQSCGQLGRRLLGSRPEETQTAAQCGRELDVEVGRAGPDTLPDLAEPGLPQRVAQQGSFGRALRTDRHDREIPAAVPVPSCRMERPILALLSFDQAGRESASAVDAFQVSRRDQTRQRHPHGRFAEPELGGRGQEPVDRRLGGVEAEEGAEDDRSRRELGNVHASGHGVDAIGRDRPGGDDGYYKTLAHSRIM